MLSKVCLKSRSRGSGPTRRKDSRKCVGLRKACGRLRAGQPQNFTLEFHRLRNFFCRRLARFVAQIEHFSLQERSLLAYLHHLETFTAFGHDVHAPVGIFLGNGDNLCCAADFRDAFLFGPDHAKRLFPVQTFGDHFLVTWLKNV